PMWLASLASVARGISRGKRQNGSKGRRSGLKRAFLYLITNGGLPPPSAAKLPPNARNPQAIPARPTLLPHGRRVPRSVGWLTICYNYQYEFLRFSLQFHPWRLLCGR